MYCPACGIENSGEDKRFCRSCGTNFRVVSQALSKSVPVKIASTLDAYLENRFQRNLMNGALNLIAFIALLAVGIGYLISGWTLSGGSCWVLAHFRWSLAFGTSGSIDATFHLLRNSNHFHQRRPQKNYPQLILN